MRPFLPVRLALAAGAVVVLVGLSVGCGSESGGSGGGGVGGAPPDGACYQNPLGCEEGTTCSFDDEDGKSMSCLPAGEKKAGDGCKNVAGAPECGEGLVCIQLAGADSGTCKRYCDGPSDCSGGDECAKITTSAGRRFYACAETD